MLTAMRVDKRNAFDNVAENVPSVPDFPELRVIYCACELLMASNAQNKTDLLLGIHRHWIWADRLRLEYHERLKANPPSKEKFDPVDWFLNADGMYLCLWYGLLFTICEGLRQNAFTVPGAQAEIDSIYDSLRVFRNAIFHVQPEYWSPKLFRLLEDPDSASRIVKSHAEIGKWLIAKIGGPSTSP
jgi:hypothetical protein